MLTAILHASYALLSFIIGVILLVVSYTKDKKNKNTIYFAFFFFLFSIYRFLLSSYLFIDNLFIIKELYLLAILVFYFMITLAGEVAFNMLHKNNIQKRVLGLIMFLLAITSIIIQISHFKLPIIMSDGFIIWNMDEYSAWITGLSGFSIAMIWVYVFKKNIPTNKGMVAKIKAYLIISASFLMGLSSLAYFHSSKYLLEIAFITAFLGVSSILLALILPYLCCRRINNELKQQKEIKY